MLPFDLDANLNLKKVMVIVFYFVAIFLIKSWSGFGLSSVTSRPLHLRGILVTTPSEPVPTCSAAPLEMFRGTVTAVPAAPLSFRTCRRRQHLGHTCLRATEHVRRTPY